MSTYGTMGGQSLPSRPDTTASRCMDIVERGMRRLGMDKPMPAVVNKIMPARPIHEELEMQTARRRRESVKAFLAEWQATPVAIRSTAKIAAAHKVGIVPARHALNEAGLT